MARKLPWAVDGTPPAKRRRTAPAPHPKPEMDSDLNPIEGDSDPNPSSNRGRLPANTPQKGTRFKTPSTSPSRAPPSAELMRKGYDGDDIYIMVEDEFQSVAQSYTAHLHHAEYKRLMKQAREAPSKALPEPTSPMSNEAKLRLKTAALQKRQNSVLDQVAGETSREQAEEDKIGDLWSGTSLAPLVVNSSQQKPSLIGLERMSSSTKAGLGFSRLKSNEYTSGVIQLADENEPRVPTVSSTLQKVSAESTRVVSHFGKHASSSIGSGSLSNRQRSKYPAFKSTSRLVDDQSHRQVSIASSKDQKIEHSIRPRGCTSSNKYLKRKEEKEKEKQSRLDEVPMFLI